MRIVFATKNKGKLKEIRDVMHDTDSEIFSLLDIYPEPQIKENGKSFAENAFIKASAVYDILKNRGGLENTAVMADDSGLCVDALSGAPGIYSSRFIGVDTPYLIKNKALLEKLKDVPDENRGASFICHLTVLVPEDLCLDLEEEMRGVISHEIMGSNGFGYDPIFFLPEKQKTVAMISEKEKNLISHRGKALRKMKDKLVEKGFIRIVT